MLAKKTMSGSLLLSHTVSSAVPSAVQALTFVFGMRTGVSPERIATGYSFVIFELSLSGLAIKDLSENILLKSLSLPLQLFDN